jgi:hypothetical protein
MYNPTVGVVRRLTFVAITLVSGYGKDNVPYNFSRVRAVQSC